MKNHEAHLEIQNIECHLRVMVTPEQHEAAGSNITPGRPVHFRVMRILSYLQDQIGSATVVDAKHSDTTRRSEAQKEHSPSTLIVPPSPHPEKVCQYSGCGGTRFSYNPGEIAGQGTEYCVKCHGAQIPAPLVERTEPT